MEKRMLSLEEAFKELSKKPVRKLSEAKENLSGNYAFDFVNVLYDPATGYKKLPNDAFQMTVDYSDIQVTAKGSNICEALKNLKKTSSVRDYLIDDELLEEYFENNERDPQKFIEDLQQDFILYYPEDGWYADGTYFSPKEKFECLLLNQITLPSGKIIKSTLSTGDAKSCIKFTEENDAELLPSVSCTKITYKLNGKIYKTVDLKTVNEAKKKVNEALEHINLQKHAKGLWDEDGYGEIAPGNEEEFFNRYAKDPVVVKYSSKKIYDEILSSDKILEMIGEDFGDGEGEPTAFIFSWKGKVAYMSLNSNDASFTPSISFSDFKKIVSGWDLPWCEIGFGNFSDNNYGYVTIKDAIKDCEVNNQVYFWSKESSLYVDEDK